MASNRVPAGTRFTFWSAFAAVASAALLVASIWMAVAQNEIKGVLVGAGASAAAAVLAAIGVYLLVRNQANTRTISLRLRVSFMFMALLPAVGITVGSVILGYINGQQQAINRLESVVALRDLELVTWSQSLQDVLLAALNEEYATERASVVLDLASSHSYSDLYSRAMRARLQFRLNQSLQFEELMLLDSTGQIVLSTDPDQEGKRIDDQPFVKEGLLRPFVQLPFEAPENAAWADGPWAFVARPVTAMDGRLLGAIAGRVSDQQLAGILSDRTGLGGTGKTYLAKQGGELLLAGESLPAESMSGKRTAEARLSTRFDPAVAERVQRPGVYQDFGGTRVVGYYRGLDELGVVLAAEQDLSEALRAIYASLAVNLSVSLLAVLLASVAAILLTRSITRPLVDLVDTATDIAGGDLQRTAPIQRDDEIGRLAVAFNTMTAQLRDLISTLEQRVASRTRTLEDAMRTERRRALQLETSARVSREITSILDNDELLNRVVGLIQDTFGYYHVSVYLLDGDEIVLRASTEEVRPQLQRARLQTTSLNTEVVRRNMPMLVNDVSQDPHYLPDEHLPETRAELVVPLRLGNEVIGTLDVLSRQTGAFSAEDVVVFQSVGDQVAIAIENARLYERSRELAVVEERNRLARDLHDSVTQSLYSLNLLAEGWRRLISAGERDEVESYLDRVGQITQQALREMRLLVHELRPPALEQEGLLGALHLRLGAVENRAGIEARVVADDLVHLPARVEEGLYWIAQEALNNVVKHSGATQVTARIRLEDEFVVLEVADNGCGFELGLAGSRGGVGLASMEERAQKLGGELTLITARGAGTTVRARVPAE